MCMFIRMFGNKIKPHHKNKRPTSMYEKLLLTEREHNKTEKKYNHTERDTRPQVREKLRVWPLEKETHPHERE